MTPVAPSQDSLSHLGTKVTSFLFICTWLLSTILPIVCVWRYHLSYGSMDYIFFHNSLSLRSVLFYDYSHSFSSSLCLFNVCIYLHFPSIVYFVNRSVPLLGLPSLFLGCIKRVKSPTSHLCYSQLLTGSCLLSLLITLSFPPSTISCRLEACRVMANLTLLPSGRSPTSPLVPLADPRSTPSLSPTPLI